MKTKCHFSRVNIFLTNGRMITECFIVLFYNKCAIIEILRKTKKSRIINNKNKLCNTIGYTIQIKDSTKERILRLKWTSFDDNYGILFFRFSDRNNDNE